MNMHRSHLVPLLMACFVAACGRTAGPDPRNAQDDRDGPAGVPGPSGVIPSPARLAVLAALEEGSSEDFYAATFFASGHNTVRDVVLETDVVRSLAEHREVAESVIAVRLAQSSDPRLLVTCFVFLGRHGSPEMAPHVRRWMSAHEPAAEEIRDSPWHPWRHACEALRRLDPALGLPEDDDVVFRLRAELDPDAGDAEGR